MSVFQPAWIQGMAMSNVIGCFRAAGVYPTDRRVVLSQLGLKAAGSPPSPTPTPFVPFLAPWRDGSAHYPPADSPPSTPFSQGEMEYFQARLK